MATRRELVRALAMLVAVFLCGAEAVAFRPHGSSVATWWPAAGFAVGVLVTGRRSWWPALALGIVVFSGVANVVGGRDLGTSLMFGCANTAEALVAAAVLRRRRSERFVLNSSIGYFRLVSGCTLGALVIGLGAGLTVALHGGSGFVAARTVAPAHLASTLVIVPLLVMTHEPGSVRRRSAELAVQLTLLLAVTIAVFLPHETLAPAFLPLPLLIWAALRFSPHVVAGEVLGIGALVTVLTDLGKGPFYGLGEATRATPLVAGAEVQLFLVCAAVMAIPAALASAHRNQLLSRLDAERELSTTTLDTTAAIICVTDPEGTVLQANATTTRLTGFTAEELVGRRFWDCAIIPPERHDIVQLIFADPEGGSHVPETREADVMTRSGARLRVRWNNSIVRDAHGAIANIVCTGIDVTSERSTTGMLRHLLEAPMATALVALDPAGDVSLFSRGAEHLLGLAAEDVVGHPVSRIIASERPGAFIEEVAAAPYAVPPDEPASDVPTALEQAGGDWTWVAARGRSLTVSTTISVVRNVTGEIIGYLCIGHDVTEQRRTQEMLVKALEKERHVVDKLRRLDTVKNEFVSTVSHELRTPTTSIVGYTEMLRDGSAGTPTEEQVPMLEAIARNGTRLIAVASDLLTLAELESDGSTAWERVPVDLTAVVAHGEEAIRPLLAPRHLRVVFTAPEHEVVVQGDAAHLDRVLMNLLSNAVKFTPDGGEVTCELSVTERSARIVVSDTGIGIPEDEQADLFTKFFRSSTAQERAIQGTGLGLSIIDQIVAAHGGDITVSSAHLRGTTFTVALPLAAVRAPVRVT